MLEMTSRIQVGDFVFRDGVSAVSTSSSWDSLTDTATITVPRKISWRGRNLATGSNPLIRRLDPVKIDLGYNGSNVNSFRGFVRLASSDTPAKILCEDAMVLLKGNPLTASFPNTTLSKLLGEVLPKGVDYNVSADYELGTIRLNRVTPAKMLEQLKQKFGVRSWFRDGVLYAGLAYVPSMQKRHRIHFESLVVSHRLDYHRKEDLRFRVKATIIYPDNTKQEVELGDPDGDVRSFHYYDISAAEATKMLEQELERLLVEGYSGKLTIFGVPHVQHGDILELRSDLLPERDGDYLIKSVDRTSDTSGFRQNIEIDTQI